MERFQQTQCLVYHAYTLYKDTAFVHFQEAENKRSYCLEYLLVQSEVEGVGFGPL
jgi:hypothetical protein